MKQVKKIIREELLKEGKVDIAKAEPFNSGHSQLFKDLVKLGFKGKYDEGNDTAKLNIKGLDVDIQLGNENLYMDFPKRLYVKEFPVETLKALKTFMESVANYGGSV